MIKSKVDEKMVTIILPSVPCLRQVAIFPRRAQKRARGARRKPAGSHLRRYFDAPKGLSDVEVTSQLTHSIALKKKIATIY
jgi:hypothetical protein